MEFGSARSKVVGMIAAMLRGTISLFVGIVAIAIVQRAGAQTPATMPATAPSIAPPQIPERTFSVMDYGATADGKTSNTKTFAAAIAACTKAGGGRVIVPA